MSIEMKCESCGRPEKLFKVKMIDFTTPGFKENIVSWCMPCFHIHSSGHKIPIQKGIGVNE